MFEKEAEEYRTHFENELYLFDNTDIFPSDIEEAYWKGAEFGYNKANEWHYPSKGEYPKDEKNFQSYVVAFYVGQKVVLQTENLVGKNCVMTLKPNGG